METALFVRKVRQNVSCARHRQNGADAFTVETIGEAADWASLCEQERVAIEKYGTLSPGGYNLTSGGDAAGVRFHPDVHKRSAKSRTGRKASAEHRAAIAIALKGKPKTKEHAAKAGAAHRGKQISAETRQKTSAKLTGKPKSPAHRAKLAAALTERNQSAEHRDRISQLRKGKPASPKARRAAGDGWRAWIPIPENRVADGLRR